MHQTLFRLTYDEAKSEILAFTSSWKVYRLEYNFFDFHDLQIDQFEVKKNVLVYSKMILKILERKTKTYFIYMV